MFLTNKEKPKNNNSPNQRNHSSDDIYSLYENGFIIGRYQSVGKIREKNEDALLTLTYNIQSDKQNLDLGIFCVADGMGGHQYGEIASNTSVRVIASFLTDTILNDILSNGNELDIKTVETTMREGMLEAHNEVKENAPGGGTTLTVALITNNNITIAHVGDSRAYILLDNQNELRPITRDHSLVSRMVEMGRMTSKEAETHPQRNILYRALGQAEDLEFDIFSFSTDEIKSVLLCSDGLWGVVKDDEISRIIQGAPTPQAACENLVSRANELGGPDNITVVLINLPN